LERLDKAEKNVLSFLSGLDFKVVMSLALKIAWQQSDTCVDVHSPGETEEAPQDLLFLTTKCIYFGDTLLLL